MEGHVIYKIVLFPPHTPAKPTDEPSDGTVSFAEAFGLPSTRPGPRIDLAIQGEYVESHRIDELLRAITAIQAVWAQEQSLLDKPTAGKAN